MRDVELIKKVDIVNRDEVLDITNLPAFDIEDYDLNNEKDFKQYLFRIKKILRDSFEYRSYISFLKNYLNMNRCAFFSDITNMDNYNIKIEIHHEPFTLFDIVNIVFKKRYSNGESLDENEVGKEIMWLHYNLLVGLIPLSKTVHLLVGNNYRCIPLTAVLGNWQKFVELYNDYIEPELKDKLGRAIAFTKTYNDGNLETNHILDRKFVYLNTSQAYDSPEYKGIIKDLNTRIKGIQHKAELQNSNNQKMLNKYQNNKTKIPLFTAC